MKLDEKALGLACAATFAILWLLIGLIVGPMSGSMMNTGGELSHVGYPMMSGGMGFAGGFYSLVICSLIAGITGWLIGIFYNRFSGE